METVVGHWKGTVDWRRCEFSIYTGYFANARMLTLVPAGADNRRIRVVV